MVTPELVEGIKKHIQSGDSEEQIKHYVLEAGYSAEVFYEALRQARLQVAAPAPEAASATNVEPQGNKVAPSGQEQPSTAVDTNTQEEVQPMGYAAAAEAQERESFTPSSVNTASPEARAAASAPQPPHAAATHAAPQPTSENVQTPPPTSFGDGMPPQAGAVPNRSAWELVTDSIKATFKHPSLLVWFLLINILAWAIMTYGSAAVHSLAGDSEGWLGFVIAFGVSLVSMIISILAALAVLFSVVHNQGASFWQGVRLSLPYFWKFIWLSIVSSFVIITSAVAFIVPAIIVSGYILLAQIVLAKEGIGGTTALARSTQLVYGKWWASVGRLALLVLVSMLLALVLGLASVLFGKTVSEITSTILQSFMAIVTIYAMYYWYQERVVAVPQSAPATKTVKRYKILAWLGALLIPMLIAGGTFLQMNQLNKAQESVREVEMQQEEINRILEEEGGIDISE